MATRTRQDINKIKHKLTYYLKRWREDPLAYVIECCRADTFGYPVKWQVDALYNLKRHRKVAIRSGHGPGKSRFLAWAHWWLMDTLKEPGQPLKVLCTGPSGSNLSDVLWAEIQLIQEHRDPYFSRQFDVTADHCRYNGAKEPWFSTLRTARPENPDALQGLHGSPAMAIIDEGAAVSDNVYEVAESSLSSHDVYALMTGNPTRLSGYFFDTFNKPTGEWYLMHVDDRDELDTETQVYPYVNPYGTTEMIQVKGRVSQKYVDHIRKTYGEHSPQMFARVRGDFPPSEKAQVVRRSWMARLKGSEMKEAKRHKRIMGVDPADLGDDHGGMVMRKGLNLEEVDKWFQLDQMQQGKRILDRYNDLKKGGKQVDLICVDCTGVGAGVWSYLYHALKKESVHVLRVMVNESPIDDGGTACNRLRDWLWWQCRLFFQDHRPYFPDLDGLYSELIDEVTVPLYNTDNGKVKVESKKELKKRNRGKSPNLADALCLTFLGDVKNPLARVSSKEADVHRARRKRGRENESWRVL